MIEPCARAETLRAPPPEPTKTQPPRRRFAPPVILSPSFAGARAHAQRSTIVRVVDSLPDARCCSAHSIGFRPQTLVNDESRRPATAIAPAIARRAVQNPSPLSLSSPHKPRARRPVLASRDAAASGSIVVRAKPPSAKLRRSDNTPPHQTAPLSLLTRAKTPLPFLSPLHNSPLNKGPGPMRAP